MIRWPWISREERDEARFNLGRGGALARGMRQAASRDLPQGKWQPRPVPPVRTVRRQERELAARRADPRSDEERLRTLARAMDQSRTGRSR